MSDCDDCGLDLNKFLELHVVERKIQDASLQISWCLDKKVLNKLVEMRVKNPKLLLIVIPLNSFFEVHGEIHFKERRYLFNLDELMAFIELNNSGPIAVFGFVVWDKDTIYGDGEVGINPAQTCLSKYDGKYITTIYGDGEVGINPAQTCLSKYGGKYITTILCANKNPDENQYSLDIANEMFVENYSVWLDKKQHLISSRINIEVPDNVFAKEPSEAEKQWVNHFFVDEPKDQCEFRRRRIFAYSVQPIIFLGTFIIRWIYAVMLLSVMVRGINFKPLYNPYMTIEQMSAESNGTWLIPSWNAPFKYIFVPCAPLFIGILAVVSLWVPLSTVLFVVGSVSGLMLMIILSLLLTKTFGIMPLFIKWFESLNSKNQNPDSDEWYDSQTLENIMCVQGRKYNSIKELPKEYRTFKLRFQEFKTKYCKPFSR